MRIGFLLGALIILKASFSQPMVENRWPTIFRQVGHEVLLATGDSTSRVLPISFDGVKHRISFSSPWKGNPSMLLQQVNLVFERAQVQEDFLLEVVDETSGEIVYSAEHRANKERELVPCAGRVLPEGRYALQVALIPQEVSRTNASADWAGLGVLFGLVLVLGLGIWGFKGWLKKGDKGEHGVALGEFIFYPQTMQLKGQEGTVELTSKEADLLAMLVGSAGETVPKEELMAKVWGDPGVYEGRTLDVYVSKLRGHLKSDASLKIVNARGVGYKLIITTRSTAS